MKKQNILCAGLALLGLTGLVAADLTIPPDQPIWMHAAPEAQDGLRGSTSVSLATAGQLVCHRLFVPDETQATRRARRMLSSGWVRPPPAATPFEPDGPSETRPAPSPRG